MNTPNPSDESRRLADVAPDWRAEARLPTQRQRIRKRRLKVALSSAVVLSILGAIIWLMVFGRAEFSQVRYIGVGITSFGDGTLPPHPGGEEDVELVREALNRYGSHCKSVSLNDTRQSANLLPAIIRQLEEAAANGERVLMYLSFTGVAAREGVRLLTIDSTETDENWSKSISISEIVGAIDRSGVTDALVFLDVGGLDSDWDLGVLANDETQQLDRDLSLAVKAVKKCNLTVLCSRSKGQVNWVRSSSGSEKVNTNFGTVVAAALRGEADDDKHDGQIRTPELVEYVKKQVDDWAIQNRRARQIVCQESRSRKNSGGFVWFPVVPDAQTEPNADTTTPKDSPPSSQNPDNIAAKPGDTPKVPAVTKSETPTQPASTKDSQEDKESAATPAAADATQATAPKTMSQRVQDYWRQLERRESVFLEIAPHQYQSLLRKLVSIERQLAVGREQDIRTREEIQSFDELLRQLEAFSKVSPTQPYETWSLAFRIGLDSPSAVELGKFQKLWDTLPKELPMMPVTVADKAPAELDSPQAQAQFAYWLMGWLSKRPSEWSYVRAKLAHLEAKGFTRTSWPVEMFHLDRLADRWMATPNLTENKPLVEAIQEDLTLRTQITGLSNDFRSLAFEPLAGSKLVPSLQTTFRQLAVAERWLASPGELGLRSQPYLNRDDSRGADDARDNLELFQARVKSLREGRMALTKSIRRFPELAMWVAWISESHASPEWISERDVEPWYNSLREVLADPLKPTSMEQVIMPWADDSLRVKLLEHWVAIQKLRWALSQADGSVTGEKSANTEAEALNEVITQVEKSYDAVYSGALTSLEKGLTSATDWLMWDRSHAMGWMRVEDRDRLRQAAESPSSAGAAGEPVDQVFDRAPGVWTAFWGGMTAELIQDLKPGQAVWGADEYWDSWKSLLKASHLNSKDSPDADDAQRDIRLSLGKKLKSWRYAFRQEYFQAEKENQPLAFIPWNSPRFSGKEFESSQTADSSILKTVAEDYAKLSLDRLPRENLPTQLIDLLEPVINRRPDRSRSVQLGEFPATGIESDPGSDSLLPFTLSGDGLQEKYKLELDIPLVRLKGGPQSREITGQSGSLPIEIQRELIDDTQGVVILLGLQDEPLDVREVRFVTAIKPEQFDVVFRANNTEREPRRELVLNSGQGSKPQGKRYRLMMAPHHEFQLRPTLIVPKLHKETEVKVTPRYYNAAQNDWKAIFSEPWKGKLDPQSGKLLAKELVNDKDKREIELQLPPLKETFDIADGIKFQIEVGGKSADVTYYPKFWQPEQFLDMTTLDVRRDTNEYSLTIEFKTRMPDVIDKAESKGNTDTKDPLCDQKIDVRLNYDPALVRKRNELVQDFKRIDLGTSVVLKLSVDGGDQNFPFSIDVAGWPHAFRYRCVEGVPQPIPEDRDFISFAPLEKKILWTKPEEAPDKPADPKQGIQELTLQVNCSTLDQALEPGFIDVAIGVRDSEDGKIRSLLGGGQEFRVKRSRIHTVNLSHTEKQPWTWSTLLKDYQFPLDVSRLPPGQVDVIANLNVGDIALESELPLTVDDSLPSIELKFDAPGKEDSAQQAITGSVEFSDPESGVFSDFRIWLDKDEDEKLKDNELVHVPTKEHTLLQGKLDPAKFSITPAKFKDLVPGKEYKLYASCKNGAEREAKASIPLIIPEKPAVAGTGNTGPPAKGSLSISFTKAATFRGTITLTGKGYSSSQDRAGSGDVEFNELEPGNYILTARRGSGSTESVQVKIASGENASVEVPVKP